VPDAGHVDVVQRGRRAIGVGRQLCVCLLFCGLAGAVFALRPETRAVFAAGLSPPKQLLAGVGIGVVVALNSLIGYRLSLRSRSGARTIEGYRRLDLAGWNPVWFALAAGVGEELLFRGALQPLLGLWATTALFVAAHARAYRFRADRTTFVQLVMLLAMGLMLGLIARYIGLYAAMITHVATDIVGLFIVRKASAAPALQPAS
jgi:hypothetical protein